MKCPFCVEEGPKSTLQTNGMRAVTLLGYSTYWDEDGVHHDHDPNTHTQEYVCSEGHFYTVKSKSPCPAKGCDFGGEESTVSNGRVKIG